METQDTHPFQLMYPKTPARRRPRNCLRIDYISDGTPLPRCNLRPLNLQAVWIVNNRPFHLHQAAHLFGPCTNAPSCETCVVFKREVAFQAVPVRVYADGVGDQRYSVVISDLGAAERCAFQCGTIDEAAAWVKRYGGALGAKKVDSARGRYREGFVNNAELPANLQLLNA